MKQTIWKRIYLDPKIFQGKPTLRAKNMMVSEVLEKLAEGRTIAEILQIYPFLDTEDVLECLRYAAWLATLSASDWEKHEDWLLGQILQNNNNPQFYNRSEALKFLEDDQDLV